MLGTWLNKPTQNPLSLIIETSFDGLNVKSRDKETDFDSEISSHQIKCRVAISFKDSQFTVGQATM